MMKKILLALFLVGFTMSSSVTSAQNKITFGENNRIVFLKNERVRVDFNLNDGYFHLSNARGEKIFEDAYFQANGLQSKDTCRARTWTVSDVRDQTGAGKTLTVKIAFAGYADILWSVTLYENESYFIFDMGIVNDQPKPYRLMSFYPVACGKVYAGKDTKENYRVLDGNGGGSPTWVTNNDRLQSFNNLLIKFGPLSQPNILVAGGVSYHEFEKFVSVTRREKNFRFQLYAEDPVGRLIDAGQTYKPNEKFYLNFDNRNPFEAMEQYAFVLRKEQDINLNYYDFISECLWYAAFYNIDAGREKFNNSKGAVEEMDNAVKSGITNYTKVAVRLVPDAYTEDNQQGWWDDKHWGMHNEPQSTDLPHYTEPYLTTESWCKAVIEKGGIPFTYMQTGRRSEDFVKLHPDWMLFNDPYKPYTGNKRMTMETSYPSIFSESYAGHWWTDRKLWGYDFTDTAFVRHMQQVYAHLKKAGIKGIFYDYPENTGWAYEGGFDDPYATTAYAYRQIFKLAVDGIGKDVLLQERNVVRGSDVTLGLVSSQRVWGDTDKITPEMVSRCGLRWYKNRVVINYDMDAKDPEDVLPEGSVDGLRSLFTMSYVTSGRFLLARSFAQMSKEQLYDLSRTFPYHTTAKSARPVDAFDEDVIFPRVYDFEVNPDWHQLTFYNYYDSEHTAPTAIDVALGKSLNEGGLELDADRQYYVYDFWNDAFVGLFDGTDRLTQTLRTGESRMMSVHAKKNHPQFISTDRHIMQGMLELEDVKWNEKDKTLSGVAAVVKNDPFEIVIAGNGYKTISARTARGKAEIKDIGNGLIKLTLKNTENQKIKWTVKFTR